MTPNEGALFGGYIPLASLPRLCIPPLTGEKIRPFLREERTATLFAFKVNEFAFLAKKRRFSIPSHPAKGR